MTDCPNARPDSFLRCHAMRLEDVLDGGEREVWRCARCGLVDVVAVEMRCPRCGGKRDEPAPAWCTEKENHGS